MKNLGVYYIKRQSLTFRNGHGHRRGQGPRFGDVVLVVVLEVNTHRFVQRVLSEMQEACAGFENLFTAVFFTILI